MTKYLYIKQHKITKMKYFGYTEKSDPIGYLGSGTYWMKHYKKHGKEHIVTIQLWTFNDDFSCSTFALKFSHDNKIVESKEWANLRIENGTSGIPIGTKFTLEHKAKLSELRRGSNNNFYGKKHSDATKEKLSMLCGHAIPWNLGRPHSEDTKTKMKIAAKNRIRTEEELNNFSKISKGRKHSQEHKDKRSAATKGRFAIINSSGKVGYTKYTDDIRLTSGEYIVGRTWSEDKRGIDPSLIFNVRSENPLLQ